MVIKELGSVGVEWICLAKDGSKWDAVWNTRTSQFHIACRMF